MKHNCLIFACVMIGLLAGTQIIKASTPEDPYHLTIVNRNLFSLKPPPNPVCRLPDLPALPNVLLTGITTLMGKPVAILRVARAAKSSEPAGEISIFLAAGASAEEGVRVLEINVGAGTVKIENHGVPQDLDILKNAPKSAAASATPVAGLPL